MARRTNPKRLSRAKSAGPARWRRRKEARPAEILEAALGVFADKGFAATRMTDIAERARVSKGTIYLYFESKESVFRALVREMLVPRLNEAAEIVRAHDGPAAPLLAQILRVLGQFIATSDRVVIPKIVIAEAGNFPDLARIYREELVERGIGLFSSVIARGIARGEFREIPVEHAVRLCVAPLLLAAIWRTTFATLDEVPYDYFGLIEAHAATLLRGLKKEPA
jgi:AcrR family transcriptional regulator